MKNLYLKTILQNPYIPIGPVPPKKPGEPSPGDRPSPRQAEFLAYLGPEALYGGAAGGGKSDALLMAALQFVDQPGYAAILLRRTFRHLNQDGGLIPRAREWLSPHIASGKIKWNQTDKRFIFPSGASLGFGYLDHERDLDQYQGGAWQFIGVDELTQFPEKWYRYLFSRLRKLTTSQIPLRMRAGSNPGGIGHEWVKKRFVAPGAPKHFVPALLADNPGIDAQAYVKSLLELDPITRSQLLAGDWDAYEGGRFKSSWFRKYTTYQDSAGDWRVVLEDGDERGIQLSQCWMFATCDPACTKDESNDPTVIMVFLVTPCQKILIVNVVREWLGIDKIVPRIAEVCQAHALHSKEALGLALSPLWVGIESDGFQQAICMEAMKEPKIPAVRPLHHRSKPKLVRATPAINRVAAGQVYLPDEVPEPAWLEDFLAECVQFTGDEDLDAHDDQVDCLAYGVLALDEQGLLGNFDVITPDEDNQLDYDSEEERTYGGMTGWKR